MKVYVANSTWDNFWQLLVIVIVFLLILVATYYTTKWIGKSGFVQPRSNNISVLETFRIAQNKYIQIIQIGTKYYAISVCKESISFLANLDEEQLDLSVPELNSSINFKDVMKKVISGSGKNNNIKN